MSSKKIPMEKNGQKTQIGHSQMTIKGKKKNKEQRCSTFIKVMQLQIKTTLRDSLWWYSG